MLDDFVRLLEETKRKHLSKIPARYNDGKLFEAYIDKLFQITEDEKQRWKEEGKQYPYPDFKLDTAVSFDVAILPDHSANCGVPSWEEDDDLKRLFD